MPGHAPAQSRVKPLHLDRDRIIRSALLCRCNRRDIRYLAFENLAGQCLKRHIDAVSQVHPRDVRLTQIIRLQTQLGQIANRDHWHSRHDRFTLAHIHRRDRPREGGGERRRVQRGLRLIESRLRRRDLLHTRAGLQLYIINI